MLKRANKNNTGFGLIKASTYSLQNIESMIFPVNYYYASSNYTNTHDDGPTFEILSEKIQNNGSILWGVTGKILSKIEKDIKCVYLITKLPDNSLQLYKAKVEEVTLINGNNTQFANQDSKSSFYKYGLKLTKLEPVVVSYLDCYIDGRTGLSLRSDLNKLFLRGQTYLSKNPESNINIIDYDLSQDLDPPFFRVSSIMGIYIHDCLGLKNIFINLSQYNTNEETFTKETENIIFDWNNKKFNIYGDDGIEGLTCILGKNGTGKSRIITVLCDYLYEWQSKQKTIKNYKLVGDVDFYFSDHSGRIIKSKLNNYIGIVSQDNKIESEKIILDFSQIRNTFISNNLLNGRNFPKNDIFYTQNSEQGMSLTYFYGGIDDVGDKIIKQDSGENIYLLFLILLDPILYRILSDISVEIGLGFIFSEIKFNLKDPSLVKKINNNSLLGLLDYIKSEKKDAYFFNRKRSRLKLSSLLGDQYNIYFPYNTQFGGGFGPILSGIDIQSMDISRNYFNGIKFSERLPISEISSVHPFYSETETELRSVNMLRQFWQLLFTSEIIDVEIMNSEGLSLNEMSTGENTILFLITKILLSLDMTGVKTSHIILDEPDTSLHPEWQRRLIDVITKVIRRYYMNTNGLLVGKVYITLTTHSPIITGDIPSSNIVGLELKEGVIKTKELKEESFLNDIYSGLNSSFFMDKYVGAFSLRKLNQNLEEKNEGFANLIGDSIIKNGFINTINKKGNK